MNDPMKSVLAAARAIEAADPEMVCINVMAGYAYSDIPDCGFSLNCATSGSLEKAEGYLDQLVGVLKAKLAAGYPAENTLDEALAKADALPEGEGPILLIEPADNIGGGTPGDATDLLSPSLPASMLPRSASRPMTRAGTRLVACAARDRSLLLNATKLRKASSDVSEEPHSPPLRSRTALPRWLRTQ